MGIMYVHCATPCEYRLIYLLTEMYMKCVARLSLCCHDVSSAVVFQIYFSVQSQISMLFFLLCYLINIR